MNTRRLELSTGRAAFCRCARVGSALLVLIASAACQPAAPEVTDSARSETAAASSKETDAPLVIAHRGASGSRPEHTLAAYLLALQQGADFLELDLVATGDGELIARHENLLAQVQLDDAGAPAVDRLGAPIVVWATTDVATRPEFADRLTVKTIDGRRRGGWFSEDFTLAELKTLRARERMPGVRPLNSLYDDAFDVPTLAEVIEMLARTPGGASVGLYIELKHPTYFQYEGRTLAGERIAIDLGQRLIETLEEHGFVDPRRLFLQCFEVAPLLALKTSLDAANLPLPLVQLYGDISNSRYRAAPYDMIYHSRQGEDLRRRYGRLASLVPGGISIDTSYAELADPAVLSYLGEHYATGVGPPKFNVLEVTMVPGPESGEGAQPRNVFVLTGRTSAFTAAVKAAGLQLHPYTLRAEAPFLVSDGSRVLPVAEEAQRLLHAGADGFFIDQPAEGRAAVNEYLAATADNGR